MTSSSSVALEGAGGAQDAALAASELGAAAPHIQQLNVNKSTMHIGPKIIYTQKLQNVEVVKGVGLGVELRALAAPPARRVRCGVAVFVCWALVVAAALAAYLLCALLQHGAALVDLETGLCRFVSEWARRSSCAERVACAGALLALAACAALVGALARPAVAAAPPDLAPHEWNITRAMWLSRADAPPPPPLQAEFSPPRLVIVQHTAGPECHRFDDCAAVMRNLQNWFIHDQQTDIPYNFLIGNDGRVYEGRGWGVEGAHTLGLNRCAVGLGFVGDYRGGVAGGARPTPAQAGSVRRLLEGGVLATRLHAHYRLLAASDVQNTQSPGDLLLAELRTWPHYPPDPALYRSASCEDLHALPADT